MRQRNLARLQARLVGNVALRRQREPNGCLDRAVDLLQQVAFGDTIFDVLL